MRGGETTRSSAPIDVRAQRAFGRLMDHLPAGLQRRLASIGEHDGWPDPALDPGVALILRARAWMGEGAILSGDSPEGLRRASEENARIFAPATTPVKTVEEISVPGGAGDIAARRYRTPAADGPAGLLVYVHGGGYLLGSLDTHDELCRVLCAEAGVDVVSLDYRLAPEHRYPAGADDVTAALRWALAEGGGVGAPPERIAVGGDSAGGNLSAVACQRLRDAGETLPALQLLLYPGVDFAGEFDSLERFSSGYLLVGEDITFAADCYIPEGVDRTDPGVSPLRGDLKGLPDAIVMTAGFDPLRDEGLAYAEALRAAGANVSYRRFDSLVHGFLNMTCVNRASRHATLVIAGMLRASLDR